MAEYKDSLNLPHTDFPMKANLSQREPQQLKKWKETNLYQNMKVDSQAETSFILHDGPPYANGHLHCGHALNKILKDIILKSKFLSGIKAPYIPGWDCHGLPIELNVEKKIGKAGHKISAEVFRAKCREYATTQIALQKEEFIRLGVFGDWEHPYTTMQFSYEANIIRALKKIIENNHLEQGFKPVLWCIDCHSALAEAEVEYAEKSSPSIDVAFNIAHPEEFLKQFSPHSAPLPIIVPIWTTTPWTLPANEAVCLHPELDYDLVQTQKVYFLLAKDLVSSVMARYGIREYSSVWSQKGKAFEQILLHHPFEERHVPILLGLHVTTDAGTGCVHTAPAHGLDDYLAAKAYHLSLTNRVLPNGCYHMDTPYVGNLSVFKANDKVVEVLKEKKALLHEARLDHSYPHCWRHNTPMIYLATPQWFIAMDRNQLREKILEKIDRVEWLPEWGKARMKKMVEGRPDWCISRQRAWGTPLPLFIHKHSRELHPQTLKLLDKIALEVERKGLEAWFSLDIKQFLGKDAEDYIKVEDTLDVWFDAGVSHFCVLKERPELTFPADLYLEGSDQYRGWFNASLTTAVALYDEIPYRTVITHGYTVDAEGKKLSKSKGNYVALDQLINQFGADVLRLWVSSTDYRHEVAISEEIIRRNADAYRRIRNTARFLLANLFDFDPKQDLLPETDLVELDRWALSLAQKLQAEIIEAYETYQFHTIYQKIHHFCTIELGSFYLDIIKDRQYTLPKESKARRSCQTTMFHIIQALTPWLAPILSFTAEEIWSYIPGPKKDSVFLSHWYQQWPRIDDIDLAFWDNLIQIKAEVNKAIEIKRKEGVIGSSLAAEVIIQVPKPLLLSLSRLKDELRFILLTSKAELAELKEKTTEDEFELKVVVKASPYEKCQRCWHRTEEFGAQPAHPELCLRCANNISGKTEERVFA